MSKKKAAILGATGVAGQQFVEALIGHPWFEIAELYASERSAGKTYGEAATWHSPNPLPREVSTLPVRTIATGLQELDRFDVVFSALPSEVAEQIEGDYATHKPVISTASAYRYKDDVPILVPEINGDHAPLIERQRKERGWEGFVVPGPNCTTMGLVISLKPLMNTFGVKNVFMTSMQALSGAGYPGHSAMDMIDNVYPYIAKEEGKVVLEAVKALGTVQDHKIVPASFSVSCTCTRVPTLDGHFLSVFVETEKGCSPDDYVKAVEAFNAQCASLYGELPSAPKETIVIMTEDNRPQPRLDRERGGGMSTVVGRIREDEVFGKSGIKYCALSHNTKRGAAKGELMAAEFLHKEGYF